MAFSAATIIAATSSFAASAEYCQGDWLGHKTDKWDFGNVWGLAGDYQYSDFYCKKQKHTATAVMVLNNNTRDEKKKEAAKGKWAKAKTGKHSSYKEWNSYFNHPGGIK